MVNRRGQEKNRRRIGYRSFAAAGLLSVLGTGHAQAADLLSPFGSVMDNLHHHLLQVSLISLVAIVPIFIALPIILWRYRAGNTSATYRPDWEFNTGLEVLMWLGPILIVGVLGYWVWNASIRLDPYKAMADNEVKIDLIGMNFKWLAVYPDQHVAAIDELVIPDDRPVSFRITSDTVMQSFMPNGLAGQIYLMPGMVTNLHIKADHTGTGTAIQTQYSGDGFANERIPIRVVSEKEFKAWTASASGAPVTAQSYPALEADARVTQEFSPVEGEVRPLGDACLLDRVVARYHGTAPIPAAAQPGSPTYDPTASALPMGKCDALLPMGMRHMMADMGHATKMVN